MSNLNSNLEVLFSKMENFISTKTVVGEAVTIGDAIIIPLVDVVFGVGAGSCDSTQDKNNKEQGGGGLGGKITPSAVIIIQNGAIQLVNVKNQNSVNKLIDMIPGVMSKLNFENGFMKKDKTDSANKNKTEDEKEITEE